VKATTAAVALGALLTAGCSGSASTPSLPARDSVIGARPSGGGLTGLRVSGNELLDGNNDVVHLHGVNRSGTEYACVQGWGIFDGPNDAASIRAIASWNVNIVRVLLNEDCWLDINGIAPQYAGANYRKAILDYVG
jgi:endoglucanase